MRGACVCTCVCPCLSVYLSAADFQLLTCEDNENQPRKSATNSRTNCCNQPRPGNWPRQSAAQAWLSRFFTENQPPRLRLAADRQTHTRTFCARALYIKRQDVKFKEWHTGVLKSSDPSFNAFLRGFASEQLKPYIHKCWRACNKLWNAGLSVFVRPQWAAREMPTHSPAPATSCPTPRGSTWTTTNRPSAGSGRDFTMATALRTRLHRSAEKSRPWDC